MGRGILEYGKQRTERVVLQERATDPASTEQGEAWLRTDIAPDTNQIATLRIDNGSETWDVPVYSLGTSATGVEEVLQVEVNGATGYVPTTSPGDASFPQLGFVHDGSTLGVHDNVEPGPAIPDSVVDNFEDVLYESGQTVADFYSGDTGAFGRQASTAAEGSHLLETSASNLSQIYSVPGNGLNRYPDEGDTVGWLVRADDDGAWGPLVAASSGVDGYIYNISPSGGVINIWRLDNSSYNNLQGTSASLTDGDWYWGEGRVPSSGDGSLQFDLYNANVSQSPPTRGSLVASVSTTDSNYVSRGIGWAITGNPGVTVQMADWLRVL